MEIVKQRSGEIVEVRLSGRLDNEASVQFEDAIAEMIRDGVHHLRLDLTDVAYVSSAGIGALVTAYRDITGLQGTCRITAASDRVRKMLQLVSLESVFFAEAAAEGPRAQGSEGLRQIRSASALFDCYPLDGHRTKYTVVGQPAKVLRDAYGAEDTSRVSATSDLFAVGVGALGHSFDECRDLFGEFVAASGSAAYMPTDGTSTPDYMMSAGDLVPEIQALYAIVFRGSPGHLLRFESSTAGTGVALSEIVNAAATVAATPDFGVVMAAEVFGLVCTMLRRPPTQSDPARFEFPAVRDWLSFASEHEYARSSSLVVGFASSAPSDELRPFVRPVSDGFTGHFHAAVTAFRSLPRGQVGMGELLREVFQPRSVVSVVHLLRDDRPIEGAGESEFHRGACWVFPVETGGTP